MAASAVLTQIGGQKQASAQNAEQARIAQLNADGAAEDLKLNAEAQATQDRQRDIANSLAITNATIESAQRQSTASVEAGERGVSGISVEHLLGDYERGLAAHLESIDLQDELDDERSAFNTRVLQSRYTNTVDTLSFMPDPGPSLVSALAPVAVAGAQEYGKYLDNKEAN